MLPKSQSQIILLFSCCNHVECLQTLIKACSGLIICVTSSTNLCWNDGISHECRILGNTSIQLDFRPQTGSLCRQPYFWRYRADLQTDIPDRISPGWAWFRMLLTLLEDFAIWISYSLSLSFKAGCDLFLVSLLKFGISLINGFFPLRYFPFSLRLCGLRN